ncbi:MAG: hypothetical protein JST80_01985 [Bdellovibrionales bacterium]|nr:hypothetical protein [Bdellovibrionales bacterium]
MRLLALITLFAAANAKPAKHSPPCFNFDQKIESTLIKPPAELAKDKDDYDFGRKARDASEVRYDFGWVYGKVNRPVQKIYEQLIDPRTIRPDPDVGIKTKINTPSHFLHRQEISIHIQPVFFLTLDWNETWAYSLLKGTKEKPESILVSYAKTTGTSHIRHFCGNILIQKITPEQSSVYAYEEIEADRRDAKDMLNGVKGTLATLRGEKNEKK